MVDDLSASSTVVAPGGTVTLTVDAHDPDCGGTCTSGCGLYVRSDLTDWQATGGAYIAQDNGTSASPYSATAEWQAPTDEGTYTLSVALSDSGSFLCGGRQTTTASLDVQVTSDPGQPPVVESLTALPSLLFPAETSTLLCVASDPDGDPITYSWQTDVGSVAPGGGGAATFTAGDPGTATVTCTATDAGGLAGSDTVQIAVVGALAEKALTEEIEAPQRLDVDSEGNLYVVDGRAIKVINFFSGELIHAIPFAGVNSVAVDWNDDLLLGGRFGLGLWTRTGSPRTHFNPGLGPGEVVDVAVDRANQRYAALYASSGRVKVFDPTGAVVASFGSTGDGAEEFKSPQGLASAPGGDWLVADTGHGLIKRFDASGGLLSSFGDLGGGAGEFVQLNDVAVDGDGIVYASDTFQSWVQAFNPDGTLREALGGYGEALGELKTPTGIAEVAGIDGLGDFDRLVVASLNASSLQVFRRDRDPLVGTPPRGEAEASPAAVDFADTPVGQISPAASVDLSNVGNAILGVREVAVDGPFAVSHSCSLLQADESCSIAVTFEPQVTGLQNGALNVDTSTGPVVVPLSGRGFLPADVAFGPPNLFFSDQEVGTVSEPKTVTLSNIGSVPLEILSMEASAEYLADSDCPSSLAGGAGCTIQVRFAPVTVVDSLLGTITVTTSAPSSPHQMQLDGRGIAVIPRFRVAAVDGSVEEGDGPGPGATAAFEISLSPAATGPTSVRFRTVSGTATAGEDFESAEQQLDFPAGETRRTIEVAVLGDVVLEPDEETFSVALSRPVAARIETLADSVDILDDEVCPGPVLLANAGAEQLDGISPIPGWSEAPASSWQIRSRSPEPHEGIAYFAAGSSDFAELVQDVDVSSFAPAIDAGSQLFDLTARLRTAEDDTARLLVEYRNWDGTVVLDQFDTGAVSSPGVWQEVADLRAAPPETRWLRVRLLGLRVTGPENDAFFDALSLRTMRAATVEVADHSTYEGNEGLTSAALSVRLACPYYQPVLVDLATRDDTAVAGQDYLAATATVTFPVGETEDQLVVDLVGDRYDEGHETFFVDVSGVEPAGAASLTDRAVGVILDDDACPLRASAWAANADLLPLRLALGGVVYEQPELIGFLLVRGNRDVPLAVARELTAARLNLRMGSPPSILATAQAADSYLAAHPPGSMPSWTEERESGRALANALQRYNNGRPCILGPPVPQGGHGE